MDYPPLGNNKILFNRWWWLQQSHATRCAIALFVIALIIRLIPLGWYVTPDEPIWVLRSVRLLDAVIKGEWAAIPQTGHPGFTTMVLGALGVQLTKWLQPVASSNHLTFIRDIAWLAPESSSAFPHLTFFLDTCRTLVALVCASGITLVYFTGMRRFGERTSRLLALFLAMDPFFAGHGGLLHTDALQATFVFLAVLFILPRQSQQENTNANMYCIAASALFLALAGLTKTLGLLIAPGIVITILLWGKGSFWQRCLRVVLLGMLTIVFIFILFPPFWIDPEETLLRLLEAVTYHQGAGLRNVFFAGQLHVDPGPFFYPAVLLFRLTAPVFVGLLAVFWRRKYTQHHVIKWMLIPLAIYVLSLTVATKKFDRYVLSIIPLLTVIASIQWRTFYTRYKVIVLVLLCLPWALVAITPLYHANTLLGGPWFAQHIIPFGWGEGSGIAAQMLNDMYETPSDYSIMTGDVPGVASFFAGQVQPKQVSRSLCADGLISKTDLEFPGYTAVGDVYIAGIHITSIYTRTLDLPDGHILVPGPAAGIHENRVPPKTNAPALQQWLDERFNGVSFTWIHAAECGPITEAQLNALLCPPDKDARYCSCSSTGMVEGMPVDQCQFSQLTTNPMEYIVRVSDILDILAVTWTYVIQAPETLDVHMRWTVRNPYEKLIAYLALRDTDGLIWAEGSTVLISDQDWLKSNRSPGNTLDGIIQLPLHPSLPAGNYRLTLSFSDNENRGVGIINPDGTFDGISTDLGFISVKSSPFVQSDISLPIPLDISIPGLHIRALSPPPADLFAGDTLPFRLEIARTTQPISDPISWAVLCADEIRSQGNLLDVPGNPEEWEMGHYYELRYAPSTEPQISNTECALALVSGNHMPITVAKFYVKARERLFTLPKIPQYSMDFSVGSFGELIGVDIPQSVISGKQPLSVTLYWQALEAAEINYTVFVHLTGNDGKVWAQSDALPEGGVAPTTTWLTGQVIVDEHNLDVNNGIPPGEYTLFAGFYDAESGYRETLFNTSGEPEVDDQIQIGKIVVSD